MILWFCDPCIPLFRNKFSSQTDFWRTAVVTSFQLSTSSLNTTSCNFLCSDFPFHRKIPLLISIFYHSIISHEVPISKVLLKSREIRSAFPSLENQWSVKANYQVSSEWSIFSKTRVFLQFSFASMPLIILYCWMCSIIWLIADASPHLLV